MKKIGLAILASTLISTAFADIPYCDGTKNATGSKNQALQYVVNAFASENHCAIGTNCLINFHKYKYAIVWSEDCPDSEARGNDPKGSTFICKHGVCTPFGFDYPSATY